MSATAVESARSLLFVPGDRPTRFARALSSGADVVIVDLEDAVAPDAKQVARGNVGKLLASGPGVVTVRVNDPRTDSGAADLDELTGLGSHPTVMVPKADDPSELTAVRERLGGSVSLVPLIETAAGVLRASELAQVGGVVRLAIGHLDLAAELGIDPDDDVRLWPARFAVIAASARAGLVPPIDGVTTQVRDREHVRADAVASLAGGFTGKLLIHPDQVEPVHAAFVPTAEEVAWAERIEEALRATSVVVVDGRMVDRPMLLRARSVLARAGR